MSEREDPVADRVELIERVVEVQRQLRETEVALVHVTAEREAFREEAAIANGKLAQAYETIGRDYVERLVRAQEQS